MRVTDAAVRLESIDLRVSYVTDTREYVTDTREYQRHSRVCDRHSRVCDRHSRVSKTLESIKDTVVAHSLFQGLALRGSLSGVDSPILPALESERQLNKRVKP